MCYKGQCHEIFCFRFFHESRSPIPLKIGLASFQIFLNSQVKVHHQYQQHCGKFATSANDTRGKKWNNIRLLTP
jgi:hypothetical protein